MDARTGSAERASATTQEDIARMTAELVQRREALDGLRAHLAEARATEAGRQAEWEMAQRDEKALPGQRAGAARRGRHPRAQPECAS